MMALRSIGVVLLCAASLALAEETPLEKAAKAAAAAASALKAESAKPGTATEKDLALPETPNDVVLADAESKKAYLDAMQRYFAYRASGYSYRSRVFEWQLFSSRVIFVVVLMLVLSGVYFAAVQFHVALRAATRRDRTKTREHSEEQPSTTPATATPPADVLSLGSKVSASSSGVSVESSVLGVVILALSLAFFYLYLVYVYPIVNVF